MIGAADGLFVACGNASERWQRAAARPNGQGTQNLLSNDIVGCEVAGRLFADFNLQSRVPNPKAMP